ncbi:MAG: hypothetical protein MUP92_00130 [Actinobacteria bacterium]|nr:hypothetical protein [Actinomycetota bacterium]
MPDDKGKTLKELAAEGEAIMHDLPDDPEAERPKERKVLSNEGLASAAAANAMRRSGATGLR